MFRLVSPFSWLNSLADEEKFMGGFGESYPSTRVLRFPNRQPVQHESKSMTQSAEQEEEKEEMETEESLIVGGSKKESIYLVKKIMLLSNCSAAFD